jgi:DNA mismatch repair protein MutS2
MIMHVSAEKLLAAQPPNKETDKSLSSGRTMTAYQNIHDRSANFKLSIDLRGKKAEEAIAMVSRYIDDAILLGIPEITIIHGKGDGVLRQVVRDYLKNIKDVKSLQEGHPDRGGAGMTIVAFRI